MRIATLLMVLFFGFGDSWAENANLDSGFYGTVSIGRGSIDIECDDCYGVPAITEALSLTASLGLKLNSRLGVVGEYWVLHHNESGTEWFDDNVPHQVTQHMTTLGLQYWLTNTIWMKAGAGLGAHVSQSPYAQVPVDDRIRFSEDSIDDKANRGILPIARENVSGQPSRAVFVAIGWEFIKSDHIAIDAQIRVGKTSRPEYQFQIYNTAFNFAFTLR